METQQHRDKTCYITVCVPIVTHCADVEGTGEESEEKYNPALLGLCVVPGHIKKKSKEWKNKECLLNSIHDNENLD